MLLRAGARHPSRLPVKTFAAAPHAAALPLLFHGAGGFWHLDQLTGKETALAPTVSLEKLSRVPRHSRFASDAYPEHWIIRSAGGDAYRANSGHAYHAQTA